MIMIRKITKLFIIFLLAYTTIACTTTSIAPINGVYPEKTSEGQCIIARSDYKISRFDNIYVNWDAYDPIVIPAGKHTLTFGNFIKRLVIEDRSKTVRYSDRIITHTDMDYINYIVRCDVTYEFQKNKEYNIDVHSYKVSLNKQTGEITVSEGATVNFLERHFTSDPVFEIILKVEVIEVEKKGALSIGSLFIAPESTWLIEAGMGFGGIRAFPIGNRVGLGFLNGKADIKLVGLAQAGFYFPFDSMAFFGYNFGGLVELHFPKIGIGFGGGMGGGLLYHEIQGKKYDEYYDEYYDVTNKFVENQLNPYFELNLFTRNVGVNGNHLLFFHYYPSSGNDWYKTIGFGYRYSFYGGGGEAMYDSNVSVVR